jgi:hypothetical protein
MSGSAISTIDRRQIHPVGTEFGFDNPSWGG